MQRIRKEYTFESEENTKKANKKEKMRKNTKKRN